MNLINFFHMKLLLSKRKSSERDRVKAFDEKNAIIVEPKEEKNEKSK